MTSKEDHLDEQLEEHLDEYLEDPDTERRGPRVRDRLEYRARIRADHGKQRNNGNGFHRITDVDDVIHVNVDSADKDE